ncbi:MAG: histidinol dehydrogenase [Pseudomonadota bacterium]
MKLPRYQWSDLARAQQRALFQRPAVADNATIAASVADTIRKVRAEGDAALYALTAQFDQVSLDALSVSDAEFSAAEASLSKDAREAILTAIDNIGTFHRAQQAAPIRVETMPGVVCERISQPLDAVGLYVPAGLAPLPSAAMMLSVPAAIAACPIRVLCSPPDSQGQIDPAILFAARNAGVSTVFKLGGAQAIAAMAYGTASIPKVVKVFGPGNAYVTEAKSQVASDPMGAAQDMPAGPSEVLVIADAAANPQYVASDLLSQAEHGPDSQVILLCDDAQLIDAVLASIRDQLALLSRADTVRASLAHSALIQVDSIGQAIQLSNEYAPEHLILNLVDARERLHDIRNAGSVFIGQLTPESLGDYCSGTNHVLPTYGYARNYSGLGVDQFMRYMTVQEVNPEGLRQVGPVAETLAALEGLDAHKLAVSLRLADLETP